MSVERKFLKGTCNTNCTLKRKAEDDFKSLFSLSSEILTAMNDFSKFQDSEIKQIAEYSESSFKSPPKL